MKHQFVVNGTVSLILSPENDMEKSLLEAISAQNNSFKEVTKSSAIGAQYVDGTVVISQVSTSNASKT